MSRKVKFFILASVILNVILIGVIAGYNYAHYSTQKRGDKIIALIDQSSLPEKKRHEFKEKLQGIMHTAEKEKKKQHWHETLTILSAKELDVEAYRTQLDLMLLKRHQNKKELVETMVEIASQLNQDERIALAEIFRTSSKYHDK